MTEGDTVIFATFLAPVWYKTCLYMVEHIEQQIAISTFLLNGEALDDFSAHCIDAGFVSPLTYLQLLTQKPCPVELIAAPVLRTVSDEVPTFFDIIVRKESPLTTLSDLRGCIWALPTGPSSSVEDRFLSRQGLLDSDAFGFREVIEVTTQAQALRLVLDGRAHATAVGAHMLGLIRHNCPEMAEQLRVLGTSSPSLSPLVVVATHLKPLLKHKIQQALLSLHRRKYFAQCLQERQIDYFVPTTDQQYVAVQQWYWERRPFLSASLSASSASSSAIISNIL